MAVVRLHIKGRKAGALGLRDQVLSRLGRFVVLAGKNGSGKTRILDYVTDIVNTSIAHRPRRGELETSVKIHKARVAEYLSKGDSGSTGAIQHQQFVSENEELLSRLDCVEFDGQLGAAVRFTAVAGALPNPMDMAPNMREGYASSMRRGEDANWNSGVLAYIFQLQQEWRECTHPNEIFSSEEIAAAIDRYETLSSVVEAFFGEKLGRNTRGEPTLFGKPIAEVKLSSGQNVALQMIVALHARAPSLGHSLLIMDEPENHLHPAAVVELLKGIGKHAPDVQIWIATHSIPLLAYINSVQNNAIWTVRDGKAEFAGRQPEIALNELLGGDESISHLTSFLGLPSQLAINNFSYECLLPPGVVYTGSADRQLQQIKEVLGGLRPGEPIRVIDFGAGKGRLLQVLQSDESQQARFDYVAYDQPSADADFCRQVIAAVFDAADERYFDNAEALISAKGELWADCMVMTNVLHEIPPAKWVPLFSPEGLPSRALRSDGYLLIVEDQQIPVGELAHQHGFLVMNSTELQRLFVVTPADLSAGRFVSHVSQDCRLAAHLVHRSLFDRVGTESRKHALNGLRGHAKREIETLRQESAVKDYKNGMKHAFWTQQLANAVLALDELS